MVAIQHATSLNLVKEELDATLRQAETGFEGYVDDPTQVAHLDTCVECLHQAWGVLWVLDVPGALDLALELEHVARQIREQGGRAPDELVAAVGSALMVLGRYLEFVQVKSRHVPELLVPALNAVRLAGGKQPVPECAFFSCDPAARRPGEGGDALESDAEVARLTRRLRQMYQVGLVSVLRGENIPAHLRMMIRALERIDKIGGGTPAGRLWWSAQGALRALAQPGVEVDRSRKMYLGGIDRFLKRVVQEGGSVLREEPPRVLVRESVYLASLLPLDDKEGAAIRKSFHVPPDCPDAAGLQAEREAMSGPGGSVIRTVAAQLRSDLAAIKELLDLAVRGSPDARYGNVATELAKVGHTLVMLGLVRESQAVKERAESLRTWDDGRRIDQESADFQRLLDDLLGIESSVGGLERRFSPADGFTGGELGPGSLHQLDDARRTVLAECRSGIALAKRGITSYIEANFDRMHLNNIPSTLKGVVGGLRFLNLERTAAVLDACVLYMDARLLAGEPSAPSANALETLADAISGVDYYLESMEEQKPMGDGVLEVAESSMDELGFPVTRRKG